MKSSRHIEMTYENKKTRVVGLAESIMNQCVILFSNLQSIVNVGKMCRLHDCCNMGKNDTIGKIELNPSSILSSDNTYCKNDIQ